MNDQQRAAQEAHIVIGITLKQQAATYARFLGWNKDSADTVGDLVVELAGSNIPMLNITKLDSYVREAMRSDGENV